MEQIKVGDRVSGTGLMSGHYYTGVVIAVPGSMIDSEAMIRVETKNGNPTRGQANIKNVERIKDMYNNLVGPKPEPVEEPKFVTPFHADGRNVVDANNRVVLRIEYGDYEIGRGPYHMNVHDAYKIADLVVEAMNEKFGKKEAPSPF